MVLPFVLRSAPKIFTTVADMAEWIMLMQGVSWCLHYIVHWWRLNSRETRDLECANNSERLILTCDYWGFPLKIHKIEGPSPCSVTILRYCTRHTKRGDQIIRGGVVTWFKVAGYFTAHDWSGNKNKTTRALDTSRCRVSSRFVVVGHLFGVLEWP